MGAIERKLETWGIWRENSVSSSVRGAWDLSHELQRRRSRELSVAINSVIAYLATDTSKSEEWSNNGLTNVVTIIGEWRIACKIDFWTHNVPLLASRVPDLQLDTCAVYGPTTRTAEREGGGLGVVRKGEKSGKRRKAKH